MPDTFYTKADIDSILSHVGSKVKQPLFPIWAEEGGSLGLNQYEWSYGNGAVGNDIGIVLPVRCKMVHTTFNADTYGTSITLTTLRNLEDVHTSSFLGQNGVDSPSEDIVFEAGDLVSFRTGVLIGGYTDARICAWFREL